MPFLKAGFESSEVQEIPDVLQRKKKSLAAARLLGVGGVGGEDR